MCPLCDLVGLGVVFLLLGPSATLTVLRWLPGRLAEKLPLGFARLTPPQQMGGWQSLPPRAQSIMSTGESETLPPLHA